MHLTTKALVIRITDYNDKDSLLTLLTSDYGKITAKARGLRRKNSPLIAASQLLAFGEFTLFEYRGQYTVNEASVIELFQGIRKDLGKLSLGTYFAQVADVLSQEDLPNPELLSLVLNSLYAMDKLGKTELLVKSSFELRSASIAGYTPDLFGCHICGSQEPCCFDISGGALLCEKCRAAASGIRMPISPSVLDAMRYIVYSDGKKMFSFELGADSQLQLSGITEAYLATQLERGFSALDFYKSISVQDYFDANG
jgi:DNA repair protein RecO (recombination protein O)